MQIIRAKNAINNNFIQITKSVKIYLLIQLVFNDVSSKAVVMKENRMRKADLIIAGFWLKCVFFEEVN